MVRILVVTSGIGLSIVMVLSALWAWQHAADLVTGCSQPVIAAWAVRIGAVALAAAAQMPAVLLVLARVYRRDATTRALTWCASTVLMLALVSAPALGLAGR